MMRPSEVERLAQRGFYLPSGVALIEAADWKGFFENVHAFECSISSNANLVAKRHPG